MKSIIRACLFISTLLAGPLLAGDGVVKVAAGSELRLAIVDGAKATAIREQVHQAFATSLGEALSAACGDRVAVKVKCVAADNAAFGLSGGSFDVVLVIGATLPRPLILSDTSRLNATLGAEKAERKAFLVFPNADEGLGRLLKTSFASAISDVRFLDALDGEFSGSVGGQKLASAR